ncbi:MAG: haloacid dehalogenase-like hydrolase [Nanoarchaeota archaeon]|nr:haloacid dehalogenase-like hydrolase [Nanoarchaeota archaeon]
MNNAIIVNPEHFEKLKSQMKEEGSEKLHVLADFDKTLTKAFVNGKRQETVIAQIRSGNYLTHDYPAKAHALFEKYHPIEIDPKISRQDKIKQMEEWWTSHANLLAESGLTRGIMKKVAKECPLYFRDGALEMIDFLHKNNIPLVIMSAGPGDMIADYLQKEGKLYNNVHIIAYHYEFGKDGKVTGIKQPIIHSMNKHETVVKNFPVFENIKDRKNVILLGDNLEDVGMAEGFDYNALIKIGFLNENKDELLPYYKERYDAVLTGDSSMGFVNGLLKEIMKI